MKTHDDPRTGIDKDGDPLRTEQTPEERGGLPLALLAWLIGVPGLIILLLLFL